MRARARFFPLVPARGRTISLAISHGRTLVPRRTARSDQRLIRIVRVRLKPRRTCNPSPVFTPKISTGIVWIRERKMFPWRAVCPVQRERHIFCFFSVMTNASDMTCSSVTGHDYYWTRKVRRTRMNTSALRWCCDANLCYGAKNPIAHGSRACVERAENVCVHSYAANTSRGHTRILSTVRTNSRRTRRTTYIFTGLGRGLERYVVPRCAEQLVPVADIGRLRFTGLLCATRGSPEKEPPDRFRCWPTRCRPRPKAIVEILRTSNVGVRFAALSLNWRFRNIT